MKISEYIWNYAIARNDAGDYFPLWGTCQGFEVFHILAAQDCKALGVSRASNFPAPIVPVGDAWNSKLFRGFNRQLLE